jgi:hypothetical protein
VALKARTMDVNPGLFEHFEWLAATMVRLHSALAFDQQRFMLTLADRLTAAEADLRDLEAMRAVTSVAPPTTGRRPAKH